MPRDPLGWIEQELADWEKRGLRRERGVRDTSQTAQVHWNGRAYVNFGSNDYLDLAGAALIPAVRESLLEAGWGSGASPLVTGRGRFHAELEQRLAEFEATEGALLFSTGYAANVGAITGVVDARDVVLSDAHNHASIIDGCRLSGARIRIYAHGDVDDLRRGLCESGDARRKLIVTDSLFSMGGDCAPLVPIVELAEQQGAMVMVDEAHATGIFGERGRGICEWLGVESGVQIRVGTLSKALGSIGGFVAGSKPLIELLVNRARTYVFSTALPEVAAAAGIAALNFIRNEPQRRIRLLEMASGLRAVLSGQGWQIGATQSQIIPIHIGDPAAAVGWSQQLRCRGLFVPAIRPPSVPVGNSLLRVSLTAGHDAPMIDALCAGLAPR